nr:hypothetical protein [Treponema sp. OMZ 790]
MSGLSAADKVDLKSGCSVKGDITAGKLRIADKVSFEGSVRMIKNTGVPEKHFFSIKSEQLKEQLSRQ